MARVLSAVLLGATFALAACPHDWSRFDDVPRGTGSDANGVSPDAEIEAGVDAVTPAPTPFAKLGENPVLLAADDEGIVVSTAAGSVLACGHAACESPTSLAVGQKDVRAIAIGSGFVGWAARGDNAVRHTSRVPGAAPLVEASDDDGLTAVALAQGRMYWAVDAIGVAFTTPGIRSCQPGQSCDHIVFDGFADGFASEMVVDGADMFWLGEAKVFACGLGTCEGDGRQRITLASELVEPHALAVSNDETFYGSPLDGGSIRAVARTGGTPRVIASGLGNITRIALTASSVWITDNAGGKVARAPRIGGAASLIAGNLSAPTGIARGGGYVYVACSGDGRILRFGEE